ncbi:MAG: SIMPL domain-containing protein [Saprospiraceae bacterium]
MSYLKTLIFCLLTTGVMGQSSVTQNFIKIVGQSSSTVDYNGITVEFTISEIAPNEYKKVRYKSIDSVIEEVFSEMTRLNIDKKEVKQDFLKGVKQNNYNKSLTNHYTIELKDEKELIAFSQILVEGYKLTKFDYLYPSKNEDLSTKLALESIDDAKIKATVLANHAGKKVGNIINIEDANKNVKNRNSSNKKEKTYSYSIIVTYELL